MGKCYYNNNTIEKLQKTDSSREFLKIGNEQIKAVPNNSYGYKQFEVPYYIKQKKCK